MKKIEVFDPAMCCETGVCGPSINEELLRFATLVQELKGDGVDIVRYGLSNAPQAFVDREVITALLNAEGAEVLPVVLVDGHVVKKYAYPLKEEVLEWLHQNT